MAESKKEKRRAFLRKHSFIVVFIVAFLIAGTNYLVYPLFISKNMGLVEIPIANTAIPEGTLVTEEMISSISIQKDFLPSGIYLSKESVVGKYVRMNSSVPSNGFFYAELLTGEDEILGTTFGNLLDGEVAYTIPVSTRYSKGISYKENQLVDFYFYTYGDIEYDDAEIYDAPIFGLLAENTRIIAISSTEENTYLTVALSEENLSYFQMAEQWNVKNGGTIYPLVNYKSGGDTESSTQIYDIDKLHNWLKEKSNIFELTEEEKAERIINEKNTEDLHEVEIISDGGAED